MPQQGICAPADQVQACTGLDDADVCSAHAGDGLCRAGICEPAVCGNGFVDILGDYAEVCDDGNTIPGDGCSADCQLTCGNGLVEPGEVCDIAPPNHQTCLTQGYDVGTLRCDDLCQGADASSCTSFSWRPVGTVDENWQLAAVWAFSSRDVYAVGAIGAANAELFLATCKNCGYLFHYDGATGDWELLQPRPGSTRPLTAIWAADPHNSFVAGVGNQMWHYDGATWQSIDNDLSSSFTVFYDLWGTSDHNLFALYRDWASGEADSGVLHYDGTSWQPMSWPGYKQVTGLWGVDAQQVYMANGEGLYVYDGNAEQEWHLELKSPDLTSVWGNADEVVAVGQQGQILRRSLDTGNAWTPMESGVTELLYRVWGDEASNFYATGRSGVILRKSAGSDQWLPMNSGRQSELLDVFGLGPVDVFAVGSEGTVLHCCGWERLESPPLPEQARALAALDGGCVYALGRNTMTRHDVDGNGHFASIPVPGKVDLSDVWGNDCDTGLFAVGHPSAIWRRDKGIWSRMDNPTASTLHAVWGSDARNVYAVGDHGAVVRWNGVTWRQLNVPEEMATIDLQDVWGADENTIFAVGHPWSLVRYRRDPITGAGDWTVFPEPLGLLPLYSVWTADACDVWVAGQRLMRFRCGEGDTPDRFELVELPIEPFMQIRKVWGAGPNDVFASGRDGLLLHFDGQSWSHMRSPTQQSISHIAGTRDGRYVYIMDSLQGVHRLDRTELP